MQVIQVPLNHADPTLDNRIRYDVPNVAQEAAHTPRLDTVNITESTGVQYCEHTADLIKAVGVTTSTKLENSAYMEIVLKLNRMYPLWHKKQRTHHGLEQRIFMKV